MTVKCLTKESLNEAIKLCKENKYYSVLIVTRYAGDHYPILNYLSEVGVDVVRRFNNPFARFLNGSCISMISSATNKRGQKANLVLYQEDIYDGCDEMIHILASIEINNRDFKLLKNEV